MSYQCLLVLTLSLLATSVSLANPASAAEKAAATTSALPKAQDPLFNKMLAEKSDGIPMAHNPLYNKMLPEDLEENLIDDDDEPAKKPADSNPKYAQHAALLKKLVKEQQQKQESTTMGRCWRGGVVTGSGIDLSVFRNRAYQQERRQGQLRRRG